MKRFSAWLINEPVNLRTKCYFWNMLGSLLFALGTMVLTIVVNRIVGDYAGGDFAMALAAGQLMATIGYFEIRSYQSTDIIQKFQFSDYFYAKIIADILMVIVSIAYVFIKGYLFDKAILALLMCAYKMIDTFADVYEGEFQQKDRIDISGKSMTIRTLFSIIGLVLTLIMTKNLFLSCIVAIVIAILCVIFTNVLIIGKFSIVNYQFKFNNIMEIMHECLPLFFSNFMSTYILNSSRYAVEGLMTSNYHSKFTAIFLPVSTINLCIGFIFKPMLTSMARMWNKERYGQFIKTLVVLFVGIAGVTLVAIIAAYFLGIPVLSILYGTDLTEFKWALLILLIGGGLNALNVIVYFALTVIRKQKHIFVAYLITFIFSLIISNYFTKKFGINGAAVAFDCIMFILCFLSLFILIFFVLNAMKNHSMKYKDSV